MIIKKYELDFESPGFLTIELPVGYDFLKVGLYQTKKYLWARIDPDVELMNVDLALFPDGMEVSEQAQHLETFILTNQVWHLFRL